MEEATLLEDGPIVIEERKGNFTPELYKEWFRTKTASGFVSITPWLVGKDGEHVGKLIVDIGSAGADGALKSSTKCYIDAVEFAVYLRAVITGTAEKLYPKRAGVFSPESFVVFGGTAGNTPVARVFKIEWWGSKKEDPGNGDNGFVWKCGHFEGKVTDSGAIQPIYDKPLSGDMIKRTRLEMAKISYKVDLALNGLAARTENWYG